MEKKSILFIQGGFCLRWIFSLVLSRHQTTELPPTIATTFNKPVLDLERKGKFYLSHFNDDGGERRVSGNKKKTHTEARRVFKRRWPRKFSFNGKNVNTLLIKRAREGERKNFQKFWYSSIVLFLFPTVALHIFFLLTSLTHKLFQIIFYLSFFFFIRKISLRATRDNFPLESSRDN